MKLSEFQEQAVVTAVYGAGMAVWYPALGLAGEAGEVSNKVKKIFRDDNGVITEEKRQALKGELGDCLWYLAGLARDLGLSLEEAAIENIAKLKARLAKGTIHGSGDNR
jgi:NTP pyrophosphatase (non-canonical NTP hydrolase)